MRPSYALILLAPLAALAVGCSSSTSSGTSASASPTTGSPSGPTTSSGSSSTSSPSTASSSSAGGPTTSSSPPPSTTSPVTPPVVAAPAQCAAPSGCTKVSTTQVGGDDVVLFAPSDTDFTAGHGAVLELVAGGRAAQWLTIPSGPVYEPTLTCLSGSSPNCVLVGGVGAHSSMAWLVDLREGRLVDTRQTAQTDTTPLHARDLNGDGRLDIVGAINDYTPDYATGHDYWFTQVYRGGVFRATGCSAAITSGHPAEPTAPVTGACPS